MKQIKIAYPFNSTFLDYPDNSSLAMIIYFIGCNNNCQNCHSKCRDQNNFKQVQYKTFNSVKFLYNHLIISSRKYKTDKLVISGGQPLLHLDFIKQLLQYNKYFKVCIYTGWNQCTIPYLKQKNFTGFQFIKIGPFIQDLQQPQHKTDYCMTLASENQNFFDKDFNQISENGVLFYGK